MSEQSGRLGGARPATLRASVRHRVRRSRRVLLVAFLIVALCKLCLVHDEEIIAWVWDASVYAQSAADLVWLPESWREQLLYRQGLPLLASGFQMCGVPYRVGLELLYLLACYACASGVLAVTRSLATALLVLPLLALHPWTLRYFHYFMAEAPAASLGLLTAGLVLHLGARRQLRWTDPVLWLAGGALALWDLQRPETLLLMPTWLAWSALIAWRRPTWRARAHDGFLMLLPLALLFGAERAVEQVNRARGGLGVLSFSEGPGYGALMSALFRVAAADSSRHAPVTRASLTAAIDASPTLARYRDQLLDPQARDTRVGEGMCGRPGEPGPRIHQLILGCVIARSWAETDAVMQQAAAEIETALRDGRLPARWAWFPVDPDIGAWLPEMPDATWFNLAAVFRTPIWRHESDDNVLQWDPWGAGATADRPIFDRAAGRRATLRRLPSVTVEGTAVSTAGELDLVAVEDALGRVRGAVSPLIAPPQQNASASDGSTSSHERFTIDCEVPDASKVRLSFWRAGKRLCATDAALGKQEVPADAGNEKVLLNLWLLRAMDRRRLDLRLADLKTAITARFPLALACASAAMLLLGASWRAARARIRGARLVVLLCVLAIALRVGFYDILIATFQVRDERYVQVASPLIVPLCLCAALLAGVLLRRSGTAVAGLVSRRAGR